MKVFDVYSFSIDIYMFKFIVCFYGYACDIDMHMGVMSDFVIVFVYMGISLFVYVHNRYR